MELRNNWISAGPKIVIFGTAWERLATTAILVEFAPIQLLTVSEKVYVAIDTSFGANVITLVALRELVLPIICCTVGPLGLDAGSTETRAQVKTRALPNPPAEAEPSKVMPSQVPTFAGT